MALFTVGLFDRIRISKIRGINMSRFDKNYFEKLNSSHDKVTLIQKVDSFPDFEIYFK